MGIGSRRGRCGRGYSLLGLLHVTGGRGCCRGGAVSTPGTTNHGTARRLLLQRLLLLLLLRRLLRWWWFLRVRRRFAYRFCNEKRDPVLNIKSRASLECTSFLLKILLAPGLIRKHPRWANFQGYEKCHLHGIAWLKKSKRCYVRIRLKINPGTLSICKFYIQVREVISVTIRKSNLQW